MTEFTLLDQEPISTASEDLYGFHEASFHLARVLSSFSDKTASNSEATGKVIAINAPWGGGKTSLVNLLKPLLSSKLSDDALRTYVPAISMDEKGDLEFLRSLTNDEKRIFKFIEFNAWLEDLDGNLVVSLADKIADELNDRTDRRKILDKVIRKVSRNRNSSLRAAHALAAITMMTAAVIDPESQASGGDASFGTDRSVDIAKTMKGVSSRLESEGNCEHLIIVIDDVDRMPPELLAELILALRWVRTLPRTTFLLLYDHELVVDGLARTLFGGSNDIDDARRTANAYLEKIVQFSYTVPVPSTKVLCRALENELMKIEGLPEWLELGASRGKFGDEKRWDAIKRLGLEPLLRTPRAVNRLATSAALAWPMRSYRRIDGRDFVLLEAVRLLNAALFKKIDQIVSDVSQGLDPSLPDGDFDATVAKILFPQIFDDENSESESDVLDRCGFGHSDLAGDFLRGTGAGESSFSYSLSAFHDAEDDAWKSEVLRAHQRGELRLLLNALMNDLRQSGCEKSEWQRLSETLKRHADTIGKSKDYKNAILRIEKMT